MWPCEHIIIGRIWGDKFELFWVTKLIIICQSHRFKLNNAICMYIYTYILQTSTYLRVISMPYHRKKIISNQENEYFN